MTLGKTQGESVLPINRWLPPMSPTVVRPLGPPRCRLPTNRQIGSSGGEILRVIFNIEVKPSSRSLKVNNLIFLTGVRNIKY